MQGQLSLSAAFMAVIVLSPLVSFAANAVSGPSVPASASTSSSVGDEDKPKDAPAPKKDDAPKAPDASLANWLAQAAAIRMGRELGSRLEGQCPSPCYFGSWGAFNAAKDTGLLLDSALESLDAQIARAAVATDRIGHGCKLPASLRPVLLDSGAADRAEKVAGGVTVPWLTAITTATGLVKDIVGQFVPQITMGPTSGSALTVDDIIVATQAALTTKLTTADSLRAGHLLADRVRDINQHLSDLDAVVDVKSRQLTDAGPQTCPVGVKQLAEAVNDAKAARSAVQAALKIAGPIATQPSAGELALAAWHLSKENVTVIDVALGSSAVSKGEYKPWYAGARMLMQATVQVRYQVIGPVSNAHDDASFVVTRANLVAVLCQSVAPVKDATFYETDFAFEDKPPGSQRVNCAAVASSSSPESAGGASREAQGSP